MKRGSKKDKTGKKFSFLYVVAPLVLVVVVVGYLTFFSNPYKVSSDKTIKIFILNSYRYEQHFTQGQNDGFLAGLEDSGLNVEYKQFFMNTKLNTSEEWKTKMAAEAMAQIDEFKPDLLYITDDNAQKYVGMNYVDGKIPIVYSGINGDPADYGYVGAKNVAGVLEKVPYIQALKFFREVVPSAKKIAVVKADDETGRVVAEQFREDAKEYPEIEILGFHMAKTFEEYKEFILDYQDEADGFLLDGFAIFLDENGKAMSVGEVMTWTVQNSNVPEVVVIEEAVENGALAGLNSAPYNHGQKAWEIAKEILIDGVNPSSYPSEWELDGDEFINLARAEDLGISRDEIPSAVLINADVFEEYAWEE